MMRSLGLVAALAVGALGLGATPAAADEVADHRAFVLAGFDGTTDEEYRAWVQALVGVPARALPQAAERVLEGSIEELRAFVDGGYLSAWHADERVRLTRELTGATHPNVYNELQRVLDSNDPAVWTDFLSNGLPVAQYADDELAAARMLLGGPDSSGPALDEAAQVALEGTPAELREFIVSGQFVARAIDAANAPAAPVPADPVPGAPAPAVPAPAVPAVPAPAAPAPVAAPAAPGPAGTAPSARHAQLAVTGSSQEAPLAVLAVAALVAGLGLLTLSYRRRRV